MKREQTKRQERKGGNEKKQEQNRKIKEEKKKVFNATDIVVKQIMSALDHWYSM